MEKLRFIIINLIISVLLTLIFNNFSIAVINIIMLLLLTKLVEKDEKMYKHLTYIYCIEILAMLLLYYGYILKYGVPYYLGGSDDLNFEVWSNELIYSHVYKIESIFLIKKFMYINCAGFIWLLSYVMRFCGLFGGYHTVILRIINIYLLLFIGILASKYYIYISSLKKNYIKVLYLICLFPSSVYISIHGFRDTLIAFIIFSIFYITSKFKMYNLFLKILFIIYFLISFYIMYYLRTIGVVYILVIIILNVFLGNNKLGYKKLFLFSIMSIMTLVLFSNKLGLDIVSSTSKYINHYSEYILDGADGLSSFVFSTKLFPLGIILRFLYGNVFPPPTGLIITSFDVDSLAKFFISIGTIMQIFMLPYVYTFFKKINSIVLIYLFMFASIVITTFGFRHFILLYPFIFIMYSLQFENANVSIRKNSSFISTLVLIFGLLFYLVYKIL